MIGNRITALIGALAVLAAGAQWGEAPSAATGGVYLAPAPWVDADSLPAQPAPSARPKAVSSVGPIDTSNLAAVVAAYNAYYDVPMPALGWTGSISGCNPGAISLAFQEWTITRINFLRAMAGVPGDTTLDTSLNAQQQAAALIMAANNTLTHSPSPGMTCYTALGASGAGSSNLALGATDSLPLYMSEPGAGNEAVGHRRWILHSRKDSFGLGQAGNASALHTFQFGSPVPVPNGIPWPPRGYVPTSIFPSQYVTAQRWSFGLPGANFGAATVSVTRNGVPVAVSIISDVDNGYGDNTIVWEMPNGHSVTPGSTYDVTIANVGGVSPSTYSYQILPFDPSSLSADLAVSQSVPAAPRETGKDIVYTLTVTNSGSGAASPVTLTDTIPSDTSFVWASPGCSHAAGTVTCNVGTIAGGGSTPVKIVVRSATPGTKINSASVSSPQPDPDSSNNTASSSISVAVSAAGGAVFRYRLYSPVTLEHHFTTDFNEYTVLGSLVGTWVQEGTVGKVLDNPGSINGVTAVPYYRLYDTVTRWHHWTTDPNEYYTLAQFPTWNAEGVDGYILPAPAPGSTPLYRLLYPFVPGLHHWTVDPAEYDALVTAYGWIGEGGSGYVVP